PRTGARRCVPSSCSAPRRGPRARSPDGRPRRRAEIRVKNSRIPLRCMRATHNQTELPMPTNGSSTVAWNFKLIAHHELGGFGGMGEGMSIQIARDGRRILWLAHESAPKNFTAVDVSEPRVPKMVVQTDLPQAFMRSNSLETVGDIMAVAYQT